MTNYISTEHVVKMFPISFDRKDKYDRVLSESNLVDWFRGTVVDSVDSNNSKHSYIISADSNFGNSEYERFMEFFINGYYVKISDRWLTGEWANLKHDDNKTKTFYIFASIKLNTDDAEFVQLEHEENSLSETFDALEFDYYETSEPEPESNTYRLCILTKPANTTEFVVPSGSRPIISLLESIDGGEIE